MSYLHPRSRARAGVFIASHYTRLLQYDLHPVEREILRTKVMRWIAWQGELRAANYRRRCHYALAFAVLNFILCILSQCLCHR